MDEDYKKILRSMDALLRPYKSIQDNIEHLSRPQSEFQDQISQLLKPYNSAKSYLDTLEDPVLKLQEKIQRSLYSFDIIKSQLKEVPNPRLETQKQLEDLLRPQRWIQDHLKWVLKPQANFVKSIRSQLAPATLARNQIADLLNPINRYLSELQNFSIDVDVAGNVSIDGEEISAAEISAAASSFQAAQESVREFLQSLITWLGQLTPRLRQAILFLVLPYVISIVANLTTPIYQEWWREYVATDARVAKKKIIRDAHELYDSEELADYRFVYATRLHIRASGSMHAEIIGSLVLGKTVRVIKRVKRWTEVEFLRDDTGETCTGWVYSRYLRKFEK
ncbi:SH3 domain-containing protein [Candidatus Thiosymbion oneisti]|uniref:SH3 domain-containing protein n=1 Tax=Candidatus Thiosymbion oneisti TaxID=589554 RepID=UPI000B7F41E9|nr:SH3 domain-containing protein [Candidatus Thiosymbion oneisti]